MRPELSALDNKRFDVVVIGAGVNGASAAQQLSAAGYTTLLVDKADFGSGSSSRSSRLLHCGLRYLAPGSSMWEFALHPDRLATALRMARQAMVSRSQFVSTAPELAKAVRFCFPVYRDGPYKSWQVALAFRLLRAFGSTAAPLDYRSLDMAAVRSTPLLSWLREPQKLVTVASFREYQFDWPERIVMDAVLDAERMGAVVRNYTEAAALEQGDENSWYITLADSIAPPATVRVQARIVLNMAGIWIDRVNGCTAAKRPAKRLITGTKGVHIMVRLPPECQPYGIATLNRLHEGFYCVPWRGMHYFGPTETLYEGDVDDIRPLEEEIAFLISEANYLMPALALKRSDVLFAWAGVRPLTYDKALLPQGKRSRELHDLAADGRPGVLALTAGPIMTHRSAGCEIVRAVGSRLRPSHPPQAISYAAHRFPDNQNSPPLFDDDSVIKLSDFRFAAEHEHAVNLVDLMFRRTGAGWTETMGAAGADRAATEVATILGWNEARVAAEVAAYRAYLARQHLPRSLASVMGDA